MPPGARRPTYKLICSVVRFHSERLFLATAEFGALMHLRPALNASLSLNKGRLHVHAGWGMWVAFVPEEFVTEKPDRGDSQARACARAGRNGDGDARSRASTEIEANLCVFDD
jgi:hypothetical protein